MFKSVFAVVVGVLVLVGCREVKPSPEEQAMIDERIAELYARVEAKKKEEADLKLVGSVLANASTATNEREKTVAFWPLSLKDVEDKKWPKTKFNDNPPVIAYSVKLNPDPFGWSMIVASRDVSGDVGALQSVAQMAKTDTIIGALRDKKTYGEDFGRGEGGNESLEWKTSESIYESNNVFTIYFRVKR